MEDRNNAKRVKYSDPSQDADGDLDSIQDIPDDQTGSLDMSVDECETPQTNFHLSAETLSTSATETNVKILPRSTAVKSGWSKGVAVKDAVNTPRPTKRKITRSLGKSSSGAGEICDDNLGLVKNSTTPSGKDLNLSYHKSKSDFSKDCAYTPIDADKLTNNYKKIRNNKNTEHVTSTSVGIYEQIQCTKDVRVTLSKIDTTGVPSTSKQSNTHTDVDSDNVFDSDYNLEGSDNELSCVETDSSEKTSRDKNRNVSQTGDQSDSVNQASEPGQSSRISKQGQHFSLFWSTNNSFYLSFFS